MYVLCKKCGDVFARPTQRGRPPSFCKKCDEEKLPETEQRQITAKERVDRLEMMLRSRNTHIGQHRDDEEERFLRRIGHGSSD